MTTYIYFNDHPLYQQACLEASAVIKGDMVVVTVEDTGGQLNN